ncbi:MAG TPA: cytidine deaminase [Polyangiaceae bacterium]|nr:cytidine deaminase [Polyangiaceae bacterium]
MDTKVLEALVEAARAVRTHAYAPYSGFQVGSAVLSDGGKIYVGCNVENASYGATICAERSAIVQLVAAGEKSVAAVAVFVDGESPAMPCGLCRQVIAELGPRALIVTATPRETKRTTIELLLPEPFVFRRDR